MMIGKEWDCPHCGGVRSLILHAAHREFLRGFKDERIPVGSKVIWVTCESCPVVGSDAVNREMAFLEFRRGVEGFWGAPK